MLTYPSALLTIDELLVSGNQTSYLYSGNEYWTMSPISLASSSIVGVVSTSGISLTVNGSIGIRPAISIKPGQLITKGTGTENDPYVIE